MLGLEKGALHIVPYDEAWPAEFAAEVVRIWPLLAPFARDIQHIGSTAVPGLAAKPILDIAVAVTSAGAVAACTPALVALGYTDRGQTDEQGHYYFVRDNPRTHQVHVSQVPNLGWDARLLFRDRLRSDPALAAEYAALKQRLAAEFKSDKLAYCDAKTAFVRAASLP